MRAIAAVAVAATGLLLIAAAPTPEAAWKSGIADENKAYAQTPHAMLKIQDAAYLREGDTAVLVGRKGAPDSYRWTNKPDAQGALTISLRQRKLTVTKNGAALDPATITKSVPVDQDVDVEGQPTQVDAGVQGWRIFVFNQKHPAALTFKGVSYYPYDAAFRVTAHFKPDPGRPPHVFRTSRGTNKQFYRVGEAEFSLAGKSVTLPMYAGENNPKNIQDFSAFFTDDLTGRGAYGSGRYVDVGDFGAFPPSVVTIDFNQAYNPNCARSAFFTCPIAVDNIPVAVKAGERDPHLAH
ncbi:MAG TPA: DUF1684 domain-containing protein [Rhizomicrobium sp.]|nr:DUF1684 domain-containing protein [Rhizomicrobium sp.]